MKNFVYLKSRAIVKAEKGSAGAMAPFLIQKINNSVLLYRIEIFAEICYFKHKYYVENTGKSEKNIMGEFFKKNQKAIVIAAVLLLVIVAVLAVIFGGKGAKDADKKRPLTEQADNTEMPLTEQTDITEIPDTEVDLTGDQKSENTDGATVSKADTQKDTDKNDPAKEDKKENEKSDDKSDSSDKPVSPDKPDDNKKDPEGEQKESYSTELSAGHYIAGVDFPAGTYNITAVSGAGNVSSSNMHSGGLNELMSGAANGNYISSFENAKFEAGTKLSISSSVTISLSSDDADASKVSGRTEDSSKAITLESGDYIAGKDFPEGTYNIVGTGGIGNVSSDNMYYGGLNEVIGSGKDGVSISEFKYAAFDKGTSLKISGTSVKLIPIK